MTTSPIHQRCCEQLHEDIEAALRPLIGSSCAPGIMAMISSALGKVMAGHHRGEAERAFVRAYVNAVAWEVSRYSCEVAAAELAARLEEMVDQGACAAAA